MGSYPEPNLLSEDIGLNIPEPSQSLQQILTQSVRQYGERTALVSCHQPSDLLSSLAPTQDYGEKDYLRWSYGQLELAAEILAAYLEKNGIKKGDALVVVLYSCAEWVVCFWAAARLGCPFVPINPAIVSRANEIQHILSALEVVGALVVVDESTAKLLSSNASAEVTNVGTRFILGSVGMIGWTSFNAAFEDYENAKIPATEHSMDDTALIVLTSGTTALPKGCPHSNRTIAAMVARHKIMYSLDETRVSCNHMPLFHLAGVMESLWAWAHGGTVVYPNKSFDALATLDAIEKEGCTDMCLVPSMLHAMVDHPALATRNTSSLGLIKLAANDVLGSDARACSQILHAKVVTNCFGMTETSGITQIYPWKEGVGKDSEPFPVGRMAPGAKARICAAGSREPIARGVIGELHLGGKTVTDRYIGSDEDTAWFYNDGVDAWHVSGDQAVMAETGEITVLGRYKDMINRAGENISPSTVERVLNQVEGVKSSQVIGVPDEVAGEVPVAVIKMTQGGAVPRSTLHDRVVKELGVAFALERVIDVKELATDDFPTSATGKVRKVDLKHMVTDYLRYESTKSARMTAREPTETALIRIWARFSGVPENQMSPTMSLEGLVDSVTVMRFRSQVKKELGKTFSLEELNSNLTIVKQAAILDRQQESVLKGADAEMGLVREGPPRMSDVVHARGKAPAFEDVRRETMRKLDALGLSWEADVEDILPIYDFLESWRKNTGSMIFRIVFHCVNTSVGQLSSALKTVIPHHGMLRTIRVHSDLAGASWVMIRPSSRWFDIAIKNRGTLMNPMDLITADVSDQEHSASGVASKPMPLFHISIYHIEATKSAGFVIYGDHSSYDAHSILSMFAEDLSKSLKDPVVPVSPRPRYDLFANTYYNHRTSVPAQLNLDHYVQRCKGIAQRRDGLWPKDSFQSVNGAPTRHPDQLLLRGNITPGVAGIAKHIKIDMSNNQYLTVYKIPHMVAMKAAIAIFNTQQTGHPYSFFTNLQMCRQYPFLEPQIADRLPDLMETPGATIESSFNNIHLDPTAPISSFIHRMQVEQNEDTARAQYPGRCFRNIHYSIQIMSQKWINVGVDSRCHNPPTN